MGKASSNKKVARAAKAGGSRAKAAGERNLLFPVMMVAVVVLGSTLVFVARDQRSAEAQDAPLVNAGVAGGTGDHWHSSYGFYVCEAFTADLPEYTAAQNGGLHTHGDGLLHIHPFSTARSGKNATLENWTEDAGDALGNKGEIADDRLVIPNGETYTEGESTCDGLDGDPIVQVAVWGNAADALAGDSPTIVTDNFDAVRFTKDGQAFTIAFAPEGADIPPPPSTDRLEDVGAELTTDPSTDPITGDPLDPATDPEADPATDPVEGTETTEPAGSGEPSGSDTSDSSTTTETTATTVAPETTTTAAG